MQKATCFFIFVCGLAVAGARQSPAQTNPLVNAFPQDSWREQPPTQMGLDAAKLDDLANQLGGRGCVIKSGYVVKSWGDQTQVADWLSSAKPVLSTMLFFAVEEGLVKSVDQPIRDFGWELKEKDRDISFRHLGSMSSGYARPESAGEAWAYNDFAIQLYQKTLFDRVFKEDAKLAAEKPTRLGVLGFQDGLKFSNKRRLSASVRDFAKIVWFWRNKGAWDGRQILPAKYFNDYMIPQASRNLPATQTAETNDYLKIASYGGGSEHFTKCGPGVYGFNWWFNAPGRQHQNNLTWPDAPSDTVMSCGAGGNNSAFIPSLDVALVCAAGDWNDLRGGDPQSKINKAVGLLAQAAGYKSQTKTLVSGTFKKWQPVTLTFSGPESAEASALNPFTDFRLDVTFQKGDRKFRVPGYFAADGNAAETSAESGHSWRAHFMPDEVGEWKYRVGFRRGNKVALSDNVLSGEPSDFDGLSGTFEILPIDETAKGFYSQGSLRYVGERYLRFTETGSPFLKGGVDSPENFLAFADFDQTLPTHRYEPHAKDANANEPSWQNGKGRNIMGALRYLADQRLNSVYFLTMNVGGDGKDVWPWIAMDQPLRYDCSKLDQWEIVFQQMDRLGLMMHVVHQEQENDQLLDGGELGDQRRLYYRELIARFSHHPALVWNLGEENTNTTPQRKAFAKFIRKLDAYRHPIVIHTFPSQVAEVYSDLVGDPNIEGPSFQFGKAERTHKETVEWLAKSAAAGKPWFACIDEIGPASICLPPDVQDPEHRKEVREGLWANLIGGGSGIEWIVAYDSWPRIPGKHLDIACEDFRPWAQMWKRTTHAIDFFHKYLPFTEMASHDELVDDGLAWCLAKPSEVYAIFVFSGKTTHLELPARSFESHWFDPHRGGDLIPGSVLVGPGRIPLGDPPDGPANDWVCLVQEKKRP